MNKERLIAVDKPFPGSNYIDMRIGTAEKSKSVFESFKTRMNFRFDNKEALDDFIDTLQEYSEIAFMEESKDEF